MIRWIFIWLLGSFASSSMLGQDPSNDLILEELSFYADVSVNAVKDAHRLRAHEEMVVLLDSFLRQDGSFHIGLDSIQWLATVNGDGFRVITWQLRVNNEEYKYGGRIQWADRIVELSDTRPFYNGADRATFTPSAWYGCLYYDIRPFERDKQTYYLLFGFNAENSMVNTKIAEVLDLTGEAPVFGLPVFIRPEGPQSRVIYTHADATAAHMVYDTDLNAVVHDHLINMPGVGPEGEALPVSDGSLEAWIFKKGDWIYEAEVYDVKVKTPPMTDDRKGRTEENDILGRPRKN